MLKQVRGIGTVFARRIVSYRNILGGYTSVDQLKEVWGMTDETFEKISPLVAIDDTQITKIDVNKASIEKLKKHPYIKTFQRAKVIYEYRRKKVNLHNINQLKHLEEFTAEDWQKLEPYLSFE
jgi:DNA uptake protein ComE-like DNA-binding protein